MTHPARNVLSQSRTPHPVALQGAEPGGVAAAAAQQAGCNAAVICRGGRGRERPASVRLERTEAASRSNGGAVPRHNRLSAALYAPHSCLGGSECSCRALIRVLCVLVGGGWRAVPLFLLLAAVAAFDVCVGVCVAVWIFKLFCSVVERWLQVIHDCVYELKLIDVARSQQQNKKKTNRQLDACRNLSKRNRLSPHSKTFATLQQ